ncbi:MAG TPA: filamentous hemagglutinin family protein, partial [Rhodocyclaceae bacterium]|nr:filamentous hemagglutinin family protein [Rhodocyclaceae bacterium]
SDSGGVVVQSGAAIDLSAAGDGDAGRLTATATKGTVDLAGSVNGAAASGAQGAVSVDAATIADFSGMNERLNAGGMTGERVFRQRTGDLALASGSAARAQHVSMAADAGNITVDGTIDASGSSGGRVELYAKQNLTLNAGSLVDAHGTGAGTQATDAYSGGGTVELVAENGALNFAGGATVDVSAGAKGDAGSVTFAAARSATGGWVNAPVLAGTVKGQHAAGYSAPQVILRGDRSYDFAADFGAGTDATGTDIPPVFDPSTGMVAYTAPTSANFTATKVFTEYAAFADNAAGIRNPVLTSLNLVLSSGDTAATTVTTAAGIELTGADMTLASALDLTNRPSGANWLRNGVAGVFTLRASGNLDIRNSIGLPDYVGTDSTGIYNVQMDWLPKGRSWSLRLVGGADLAAADPLALQSIGALNGKGSVTIHDDGTGSGIGKVRTGTGSIDIAAGNNFVIGSAAGDQAVVYSAGIGEEPTDPYGRYTSGGGDIRIVAQGDAVGSLKPASQATSAGGEFVNDWLRRTTLYDVAVWPATPVPSSWWAWRPLFREDIASFGGGDIAMNVGGSIANMGVMSPTSGRGSVEPDPFSIPTAVPLTVRGGGNVTVTAGRDIVGGEVLVGLGRGDVRAGGNLGTTAAPTAAFVMGLGSDAARGATSLRMEAGGNAIVQNVSNPTILASTGPDSIGSETYWNDLAIPEYGFGAARAGFFTYAPDSSAEIVAVGGNVSLGRTIAAKPDGSTGRVVSADWSSVAPPKLTLAALTGDIVQPTNALADLNKPIDLYPSAEAAYTVLAGGNIKDLGMRAINMDPSALPSWSAPGKGSETGAPGASDGLPSAVLDYRYAGARIVSDIGASAGPRFVLEAASGDITGATVVAPAAATVRAGRDIVGAYLDIQNLAAGDVSVVAAGRDIVQDASAYHGDGLVKLSNTDATMAPRIYFSGPGAGVVEAGRNVDLMDSKGILADGNTRNSSLHDTTSARLYVLAGVQGPVALGSVNALMAATRLFGIMEDGNSAAMARDAKSAIVAADSASPATLDALDAELAGLAALGRTKDIRAAAAAARPALASARATQKDGRNDILDALLAGLRDMSGMDTKDGAAVNAAAAAATRTLAVAALAGNKTGPGEIDLSKTQIQTTGGSGIALLVPGYDASGNAAGVVNVGLPSGAGGNTNIGVVTQTGGAIDAYVTGDFNVNQSKVLTSQGGDIMLYSDSGSIDAGRGALTSRSSSPPRRKAQYDKDGAFTGYVYLPPLDVAGSGIRTVTSDPDGPGPLTAPPPGSVFLFAPKGTINAGEAGIASAGDVTLRAVQVLNANAISAGGSASGVPQASVTPVGALGTTPTPGAKNDDLMKNLPAPSYGTKDDARPRILMVEVLGFGDSEDVRIERKPDEKKCGRESGSGTACNESEM